MDDQKPQELVEKLLNEDPGDENLDPVYLQRRDAARAHGGHPTPGAAARADDGEDDDLDDDEELEREEVDDPEEMFEGELHEAIETNIPGARCRTFSDNGVMTRNKGLVVDTPYGTFQVTIVLSRRA